VAPVLPEAAKQPTRPGAEAFFRYFWDVYAYSFVAQDTSLIRSISDPTCKLCASATESVQGAEAARHRVKGGGITVTDVAAAPGEPAEGLLVNGIFDQQASSVVDQKGTVIGTAPANRQVRVDAVVRWLSGSWQMRGVHVFPKRQA
jgi:hypothetical protein